MRTIRIPRQYLLASMLLAACEDGPSVDGPEDVFDSSYDDVIAQQNGDKPNDPWAVGDDWGYESDSTGDSVGRARFCDDAQAEAQVQDMIKAPIVPDRGIGTLPLWGESYQPLLADDLLGTPDQGKYCDPSGTYSNAFTFGPLNEIIVIFNEETRLVESMYASKGYLGALEGKAKNADGKVVDVWIRPGDPVRVGKTELKDDNQASTQHWLHPQNINLIYRMLRSEFFPAAPEPALDYDCLEARICRILEVGAYRALRVEDSGVVLFFPPQGGAVDTIILEPVRVAPFEASASLTFGGSPLGLPEIPEDPELPPEEPVEEPAPKLEPAKLAPAFESGVFENCKLALDGKVTWKQFKAGCVKGDDTLSRASYDVFTARDAVRVDFNGVFLSFLRKSGKPLEDGELPGDDDVLWGISFTDNLNSPLAQWIPETIGAHYKQRLEALVQGSLLASMEDHPFASFSLGELPALSAEAGKMGPLSFVPAEGAAPVDLVETYTETVQAAYAALTPEQKAVVDANIAEKTFLVNPFVQAVLATLTGGASDLEGAVVTTIPSDDELRVTGRASFMQGSVPYRVFVSHNFVFGGVVYAGIERGFSAIDGPINEATSLIGAGTYYEHYLGLLELGLGPQGVNPFALGAASIQVDAVDRKRGMLDVKVTLPGKSYELKVPGDHISDGAGFMRQIEGETSEFIASHVVNFYGKETGLSLNVDADGVVQQTTQVNFKGPAFLCGAGNPPVLVYGDDVRAALDGFAQASPQAYRDCGIVFNYSANGNVLESVVSVINKVGVTVSGGRAISVSAWQ